MQIRDINAHCTLYAVKKNKARKGNVFTIFSNFSKINLLNTRSLFSICYVIQDASIIVYKHSWERTGFNMYAENTQRQLPFLDLLPWFTVQIEQSYFVFYGLFFTPTARHCRPKENVNYMRHCLYMYNFVP